MTLEEWFDCPNCEDDSDELSVLFNNGRIIVTCESCFASTSKLVGRATFR